MEKQTEESRPASGPSSVQSTEPVAFKWVMGSEYLALPRAPQPWLIENVIPIGGLANMYGKPKLGKSYAALGIAEAVSCEDKDNWLGFAVKAHGTVAYMQVDTPRSLWATRVETLKAQGHNIDNIAFIDGLMTPYPVNMIDPVQKQALKSTIHAIKPTLFIVDTLREVHGGDENDSGAMREVITAVVECCREVDTAILFISHSRKDATMTKWGGRKNQDSADDGDDNIMDDGRGSSYVSGRMDVVIKLTSKSVILKGRAISETKVPVEQDKATGMIVQNAEDAEKLAHIQMVMTQPKLTSDRQRAEMLAALENIKLETARSRIREWRKKFGGVLGEGGDDGETGETAN